MPGRRVHTCPLRSQGQVHLSNSRCVFGSTPLMLLFMHTHALRPNGIARHYALCQGGKPPTHTLLLAGCSLELQRHALLTCPPQVSSRMQLQWCWPSRHHLQLPFQLPVGDMGRKGVVRVMLWRLCSWELLCCCHNQHNQSGSHPAGC